LGKQYCCPSKNNRQVDDSNGSHPYTRVDGLHWSGYACESGKTIKIRGFPEEHKVQLCRVAVSGKRTDWVVTKGLAQNFMRDVQNACALHWKIEQFHREAKQLTGVEKCQWRKARIQGNHIAYAVLVWVRFAAIARKMCTTIYKIKSAILLKYLRQELLSPSVRMEFLQVLNTLILKILVLVIRLDYLSFFIIHIHMT